MSDMYASNAIVQLPSARNRVSNPRPGFAGGKDEESQTSWANDAELVGSDALADGIDEPDRSAFAIFDGAAV